MTDFSEQREHELVVPRPPVRARMLGAGPKVLAAAIVLGLVGGMAGSYMFVRYFASAIPADRKQLVVQESSAVVDVAQKVSPAVVSITTKAVTQDFFGRPTQTEGAGTGMIVTADGLILTNRHVVDDATANYTVVTSDGKTYAAKVVSRDSINDIAFVQITASNLPTVALGDSGAVKVGQRVVAIGNALGQFQNTVTEGIISGLSRGVTAGDSNATIGGSTENLQNLLQTDAAINPGNSGGPLVNLDGQVVGINTAVAGQGQNLGFAIPINEVKPLVASVKSAGRIVRPYLGVRYVAVDKQVAAEGNLSVSNGAWVKAANDQNPGVVPGSPAAKAGVKEGDIITKVGGDTIDATHSLQSLVGKHKVGDKVGVMVLRDGKTQTLSVTLEAAPVQ
ncbi:MAG TPA: trypsin-like peptidase domain-containing protein [Candidatus Saccharimonadia bacterium]|nr:trypsin-like peptidase domain-containing protein [Candidatus Saccharimonadia bacterium]